jgi:hypothetical protein
MKKPIILLILALMLLVGSVLAPSYSQSPTPADTPTFYRLVPGTYVNGYPRFTIHYPKDWVEKSRIATEVFRAESSPPAPRSALSVNVFSNPHPIDKLAEVVVMPYFKIYAQDVSIVSDKAIRLKDGTPAREVETKMVMNGEPINMLNVATKSGDMWVNTGTRSYTGKIEDYQRVMLYSLRYETGEDKPVKVPSDIQALIDAHNSSLVSHDLAGVMSHYSDRYLNSGMRKGEAERAFRQWIGLVTTSEVVITEFISAGDIVHFAGFATFPFGKVPMQETSIIKENGEWKWYGNQRDVAP